MKKLLSMLFLLCVAIASQAQVKMEHAAAKEGNRPMMAQRKFKILVENEQKAKTILETNDNLLAMQEKTRGETDRGLFGDLLWAGLSSAFKQKTVNATSNLVSFGMNYLKDALKGSREKWYNRAMQQCYYNHVLSAESTIDDFYALPSTKGAMDPENLKFQGFGCKNYIELANGSKEGVGVFYIFCKMRRDSVGLRHIVNHSKFLVEIDTLMINPRYCNLPNDSTGSAESRFSFEKRDNLVIELKVRLFSSWMNQATMIANDQQLGEFAVRVKVDKNKLNSDGLFIYDKNDPDFERLVSIDGDSYIVPRSYTGTPDGFNFKPTWGTGQYRVEMEVTERCRIVDSYYQIDEVGKGEAVAFADATPGKKKWDKNKWKAEWNAMKAYSGNKSFLANAWDCVISAYKGSGWMATLTDPVVTALYSWETKKLDEWVDDAHEKLFSGSSSVKAVSANPSGASSPNGNVKPGGNGGSSGNKTGKP